MRTEDSKLQNVASDRLLMANGPPGSERMHDENAAISVTDDHALLVSATGGAPVQSSSV